MQTKQIVLSRGLPKTNQTTEFESGDDGTHQAGWWKGLTVAVNRTRFIEKTVNSDVVIIDRATGLMWVQDGNSAGANSGAVDTWAACIAVAGALNFAGFEDWRLPNIFELISLIDWEKAEPVLDALFDNISLMTGYWSSTNYRIDDLGAWTVSFATPSISQVLKTGDRLMLSVRGGV